MKQHLTQMILLLTLLCLLIGLTACNREAEPILSSEQTVPTTTEAPRPMPEPGHDRLELDGTDLGPILLWDGYEYVSLEVLRTPLDLTTTELGDNTLRLSWEGESLILRDGSNLFERPDGQQRPLSTGAPVLRGRENWYLPVETVSVLWSRVSAYDADNAVLRCLQLEKGPALRLNGAEAGESFLLDGVPILDLDQLLTLTGAETGAALEETETPNLYLNGNGHSLTVRAGSLWAELDGEALELPVPACISGENWVLPVPLAEALGCVIWEDAEAELIEVWQATEGPELWFNGMGMRAYTCAEVPCAALTALTEAIGGTLTPRGNGIDLTVGDHKLFFQTASHHAIADGTPLTLPIPVLPCEEQLLVPVEPIAEALQIPKLEGEALVFSRMEPRDTVVWVDGREANTYGIGEDDLCLRLNDVFFYASNEPVFETNSVEFTALGKRIALTGGSAEALADGEALKLSAPVRADGGTWYAPTELLTALGLTELEDPDLDQIYYTHIVRHEDLKEGYRVPVLMYHAVSDDIWGIPELFISPSTLEKQLQALTEGGYTAITFEDLDHIDEIEKPVMLTFDDGYDDNYTELFPLLKQYNVKATVFVIVNDLGKNHKLTKAQVKEMSDSGLVSIQSHTMSHNYLDGMSEKQLIHEHYDSMIALARITGKQPFVMCYPTGKSSGYSRNITADYYEYGLCMGGPCWVTGDAPYRIYRYYIPRKTSVETFLQYLEG